MMPTAQEVTDTSIRRAAACSITLHSVCMVVAAKNLKLYPIYRHGIGCVTGKKSHTIDDFGMMPTAQEVADTSIRRAAACSITLHSVCMVVAAKNFKLYPIYRHGIGVKR
mgnify:CR=1 FL=1